MFTAFALIAGSLGPPYEAPAIEPYGPPPKPALQDVHSDSSGYVGVNFLSTSLDANGPEDSLTGAKIYYGYRFNETVGAEFSYFFLAENDDFDDSGVAVEASAFSLTALGYLPMENDQFEVFGRIGLLFWDLSTDPSSFDDDGSDLMFGVGANYTASDRVKVRLDIELGDVGDGDQTSLSIGALLAV